MKEEKLSENLVVKYVEDDISLIDAISGGISIIQTTTSNNILEWALSLSDRITKNDAKNRRPKGLEREEGEIEVVFGEAESVVVLATSLHADGMLNIEAFISCMDKFFQYSFEDRRIFVCLCLQKLKGTTWGILKQYLLSVSKDRKVDIILFNEIKEDHEKRAEERAGEKGEAGTSKGTT